MSDETTGFHVVLWARAVITGRDFDLKDSPYTLTAEAVPAPASSLCGLRGLVTAQRPRSHALFSPAWGPIRRTARTGRRSAPAAVLWVRLSLPANKSRNLHLEAANHPALCSGILKTTC